MRAIRRLFTVVALAGLVPAALAASAPAPALPGGIPGSETILLGVNSVRADLNLTSLQKLVLDQIRSDYRDEARTVVANTSPTPHAKAEALAKLNALTARYDKRALRTLNSGQRKRLTQIERQILGGYALFSQSVQADLGITPAQKAQIAKIWAQNESYVSKVNSQFEKGKISYNKRLMDLHANRLSRSAKLLGILTKDQHAKLQQLLGPKFVGAPI
ncbi:MAG TPA: hypothetical protein VIM48_08365 [Chthoniobacterales bacterium]